jgi:hypothetical protein
VSTFPAVGASIALFDSSELWCRLWLCFLINIFRVRDDTCLTQLFLLFSGIDFDDDFRVGSNADFHISNSTKRFDKAVG